MKKKIQQCAILHLKRITRLCKTLWYQFQKVAYQFIIDQPLHLQQIKLKVKKIEPNIRKNGYLYAPFSQKLFLKSKTHSLIAANDQIFSRYAKICSL